VLGASIVIELHLTRSGVFLLGAFTELRKATISFVMSVHPYVRPHGIIRLPLDVFP
jgi:hypothetical protein